MFCRVYKLDTFSSTIYSLKIIFYGVHQFASLVCNPILMREGFKILYSKARDYKSVAAKYKFVGTKQKRR